jgi:hypothetical protein
MKNLGSMTGKTLKDRAQSERAKKERNPGGNAREENA